MTSVPRTEHDWQDPRSWVEDPRYTTEFVNEFVEPLLASWDADRSVLWTATGDDIMGFGAAYEPKGA